MRRSNSAASSGYSCLVAGEQLLPDVLGGLALLAVIPLRLQLVGNDERLVGPVQLLARLGHFVSAQRLAVS